jgi:hypothetical protein
MSPDYITPEESRRRWNAVARRQQRRRHAMLETSRPATFADELARYKSRGYANAYEVALKYNRSPSGIQQAMKRGDLPFVQVGHCRLLLAADYEAYMKRIGEKRSRIGRELTVRRVNWQAQM